MRDCYGDETQVWVDRADDEGPEDGVVYLSLAEADRGAEVWHEYTPRKARKLAAKLLVAAADAEGKL